MTLENQHVMVENEHVLVENRRVTTEDRRLTLDAQHVTLEKGDGLPGWRQLSSRLVSGASP
ncbi:hypothetical protein ACIBEJ_21740 [Nonomuraea sp. NPDC050790]|uniref:hypothetical protein n=1 Tax=Nonomuraea sp. NPDC050790 TaxID=3364371 RepID=UPI0037B7E86C